VRVSPLPLYHIFAFYRETCIASVCYWFHSILITNPRDLDGSLIGRPQAPTVYAADRIQFVFVALMGSPDFGQHDFSQAQNGFNSGAAPLNKPADCPALPRAYRPRGSREGYGLTETSPVVVASTSFTPYKEGFIGQDGDRKPR